MTSMNKLKEHNALPELFIANVETILPYHCTTRQQMARVLYSQITIWRFIHSRRELYAMLVKIILF